MPLFPAQRLLVPVDLSDASLSVLREAVDLAVPGGLHVVHVLPDLSPAEPGLAWGTVDDHGRLQRARAYLERRLHELGVPAVSHLLVSNHHPAMTIVDLGQKLAVDAIVLASHGSGATRLFVGSVAERVVRLADRPVLVLRGH